MLTLLANDALWSQFVSVRPWAWAGLVLLVVLVMGAVGWFTWRRVARRFGGHNEAEMMLLRGLDDSSALTEEERRKVRAALARQYMRPAEEPVKAASGMSPLQQLAMEAQRLEEEARLRGPQKRPPAPSIPEHQPEETPSAAQPDAATRQPPADLPPMLQKLLNKSEIELEDMVAAGLIGEEDLQWVKRERGADK